MAQGKSTYLANKIADLVLGGVPFTPEATVWIALYLSPLNEGGSGGTEVSSLGGSAYIRFEMANTTAEWALNSNGIKTNLKQLRYPTAQTAWGLVDAVAIYDAPTGGNILYFGSLTSTINVTPGDAVEVDPGAIQIREG